MSIATKLTQSVAEANEFIARQGVATGHASIVCVSLSKAQRRYLAELYPTDAALFQQEASGTQVLEFSIDRVIDLAAKLEEAKTTETGSKKNAASKALKAIEKATLQHCKALASVGNVYQLRIELDHTEPVIWRRIEIPNCTFLDLHDALQVAMGWEDCHLFEFRVDGRSIVVSPQRFGFFNDEPEEDAQSCFLADVITDKTKQFEYEYDFGDSWRHTITIESIEQKPTVGAARCTAGERACPPEDCGGIYGFYDLLAALEDPARQDEEKLEWHQDLEPDRFSVDRVNQALRRMF